MTLLANVDDKRQKIVFTILGFKYCCCCYNIEYLYKVSPGQKFTHEKQLYSKQQKLKGKFNQILCLWRAVELQAESRSR